jgi:hypothetical protein
MPMTGRMLLRLLPIAAVLALAACGGGKTGTLTTAEGTLPNGTVTKEPPPKRTVRAYLLRDGKVAPVARSIYVGWPLQAALASGPTDEERKLGFTTDVPNPFDANKLSRQGLAQLTYTLTQLDPSRPRHVYGRTWDRKDYEDETPIILVESPLLFQHVKSPLRATGTANTFEATFNYDLVDADGKVVATHFVTATSGSGTRGTFDFTVPFTVAKSGLGKLKVYELSAADGSRIHENEIPIYLEQ